MRPLLPPARRLKLSRRKHGTAITLLIHRRKRGGTSTERCYFRRRVYTFRYHARTHVHARPREFKKPDSGIARRNVLRKKARRNRPRNAPPTPATVIHPGDAAIWSGPYDECRVRRICERRGKMRVVSFPAGIFHRFRHGAHTSALRVPFYLFIFFPWKGYPTFRPRDWLARNSAGCFDKFAWRVSSPQTEDASYELTVRKDIPTKLYRILISINSPSHKNLHTLI